MNAFTSAARAAATYTTTENGHAAVSTTGTAVLDLYGLVGALRGCDHERLRTLFDNAANENKLLTAKTMFYARDARGGVGERQLFRDMLHYAAIKYPEMVRPNLIHIPYFGRWDDMYALVATPLEDKAFALMKQQFEADLATEQVSLLGKWLKSCNASSAETRRLGLLTAKYFNMGEKQYRKALTLLRARIKIVETQMSQRQWNDIRYDVIPSRAGLVYHDAFMRHDPEGYTEYLEAVRKGKAKINAAMNTPQDLVHQYMQVHGRTEPDETVELMWKNLPDYVDSDENILCMVDVSGSMTGRPIEVSTGLGMYFAQHNKGAFHNLLLTFSAEPRFVYLEDNVTMLQNLQDTLGADWGMNTDLNLACERILDFAVEHKVPDSDMPRRLIVISDMEIDDATSYYSGNWRDGYNKQSRALHADELREMYEEAGYTMPQVIYWNVASRENRFQTRADTSNTMLASGSSPAVFTAIMEMKDLDITPAMAMEQVLNSDRYSIITVE